MHKSLVALAIIGAASVPASAQTTQAAPATANQTRARIGEPDATCQAADRKEAGVRADR